MVALDRLTDPAPADALHAASAWLLGALSGTFSTMIAVIAVAIVGLLMLSGRIDWRRGMAVGLGCFLLFGAGTIADGLTSNGGSEVAVDRRPTKPEPVATPARKAFDPYAGAAPSRQ